MRTMKTFTYKFGLTDTEIRQHMDAPRRHRITSWDWTRESRKQVKIQFEANVRAAENFAQVRDAIAILDMNRRQIKDTGRRWMRMANARFRANNPARFSLTPADQASPATPADQGAAA